MDCRASVLLAAAWAAGCVHQEVAHKPIADPVPAKAPSRDAAAGEKPKKNPKPATCVAFGNLHEQGAADPDRDPAERDLLRDQARRAYAQALSIDPNFLTALTGMGRLYENAGEHDQGVAYFRKALDKHPKEAGVWHELGMIHARHKEWDPALACLRKAVELEPANHHFVKTLGFCLARAGRYDESHACLKKVLGDAEAHFCVARMLLHLDQHEAGVLHLQAALQANPKFERAAALLAEVRAGGGSPIMQAGYEEALPE
jgi:tetratricopeptide (TPR) repeat protein